MRVLLTSHQFLPKHTYGTETLTFDTARELMARGHDVNVFTSDAVPPEEPHNAAHDYVYKDVKVRAIGVDMRRVPDPVRYEYDNPQMADQMREYMRETRPDVVHVMHAGRLSGSIVPAAKEFGVPVVFTATDYWFVCRVIHLRRADTGRLCTGPDRARVNCFRCYVARSGLSPRAKQAFARRSDAEIRAQMALAQAPVLRDKGPFRSARRVAERPTFLTRAINMTDRVIAPTKLTRDLLVKNGIDPHRITLSPYGMDTSAISAVPWSPARPPTLRFGFIGALAPHKGADILVKAFRDIPEAADTELKIYGSPKRDPRFYNQLVELAGEDDRIGFAGTFEAGEMGGVLSGIDVLVIPSRWYENTPLVVYSALASGTPVVATDLGGLSEVIDHDKNGLLFVMGDVRGLNRLMLRFFFERDLIERLRFGMEPVRTVADSVDELEELYEVLLRPPRPVAPRG